LGGIFSIQRINNNTNEDQSEYTIPIASEPHSIIQITDNSDFTNENGVSSGDGSQGNPYIIENLEIDASIDNGIFIDGTDKYLIIRNCTVENGATSYHGIWLMNTQYITIENTTIQGNKDGILIDNSQEIVAINNTITSNNENGISMKGTSSHDNVIENNTLFDNFENGVYLEECSYNTITNNRIYENDLNGVYINGASLQSSYNIIGNNTIHHNNNQGVFIGRGVHTTITNNSIYENIRNGIYSESSSSYLYISFNTITNHDNAIRLESTNFAHVYNNTLTHFHDNFGAGVNALNSHDSNIENNTISNTDYWSDLYAIQVQSSDRSLVSNNAMFDVGRGINIIGSDLTKIENNSIYNVEMGVGIFTDGFDGSHNTTIYENTFTECEVGVELSSGEYTNISHNIIQNGIDKEGYISAGIKLNHNSDANHTTIEYNQIINGDAYGIYIKAHHTVVMGNNISHNSEGIWMESSLHNHILSNNISASNGTHGWGVYVKQSTNNTISSNTIFDNDYGIYLAYSNNNSIQSNNISYNYYSGIHFQVSNTSIVYDNDIHNNDYGIRFMEAKDNVIWFNSFWERGEFSRHIYIDSQFQNHFNHTDTENYRTEVNLGNYYDDYASATHDGMVWDTERDFFGKGMDYYPLVNKNRTAFPISVIELEADTALSQNGFVSLNWTESEYANVYFVYRCESEVSSADELEESCFIGHTELLEFDDVHDINGTYYYFVIATNPYTSSEISVEVNVEIAIKPPSEEENGDGDNGETDGETDENQEVNNNNGTSSTDNEPRIDGFIPLSMVSITLLFSAILLTKQRKNSDTLRN